MAETNIEQAGISIRLSDTGPTSDPTFHDSQICRTINTDWYRLELQQPVFSPIQSYSELLRIKTELVFGRLTDSGSPLCKSFGFCIDGHHTYALTSGLAGFQDALDKLLVSYGPDALLHHLPDFFSYIRTVCEDIPEYRVLLSNLDALEQSGLRGCNLLKAVGSQVSGYVNQLNNHVRQFDQTRWISDALIYYICPEHYNPNNRRQLEGLPPADQPFLAAFGAEDLQLIKKILNIDSVWICGIFEKGGKVSIDIELKYGWSPFSVKDHRRIRMDFGVESDLKNFIDRLHASNIKVIMDLIPNHASHDSTLATTKPWCFIHRKATSHTEPTPPEHVRIEHESGVFFMPYARYVDNFRSDRIGKLKGLLQLDLYNPETQEELRNWIRHYVELGVDGFRVDMGDSLTRRGRNLLWREYTGSDVSNQPECLYQVRKEFPKTAMLVETYSFPDELLMAGADAVYFKGCLITRRKEDRTVTRGEPTYWQPDEIKEHIGRWEGFMDPIIKQDADALWLSNHRHKFHEKFGMGLIKFVTNHDCAALLRLIPDQNRAMGAMFYLLLHSGGILVTAGQEVDTDYHDYFLNSPETPRHEDGSPEEEDDKFLKFSIPNKIDWHSGRVTMTYLSMINDLRNAVCMNISSTDSYQPSLEFDHPDFKRLPIFYLKDASSSNRYKVIYNVLNEALVFEQSNYSMPLTIAAGDCVLIDLQEGRVVSAQDLYKQALQKLKSSEAA